MDKLKQCPFCGCKDKKRIIGKFLFGSEYRVEHFCKYTIKTQHTAQTAVQRWTIERKIEMLDELWINATVMQSCEDPDTTYLCVEDTRLVFRDGIYIGWYEP